MTVENVLTGVGRIVWGNPAKSQIKKDPTTKQPVIRDGQQVEQWAFGVAFPKAEFEQMIWPYMAQEAAVGYPNGVPGRFSWKYKDGDGIDSNGRRYSDREGYAGHYVLTVTTEAFAPPIHKWNPGINDYVKIGENEIKTGDYVRLNLNMKVNVPTNPSHTPGLYINPNGVELVGYGTEIASSGPSANEMFGGQPVAQLPAGASATPLSSAPAGAQMPTGAPAGMPQAAPQTAPMAQPAPMGNPPAAAPAAPANMAPPATDFVANATGYQAPAAGMPQAAPAPMGNPTAPAPAAAPSPMPGAAPQMAAGTAQPATSYPTNGVPGMPPAR